MVIFESMEKNSIKVIFILVTLFGCQLLSYKEEKTIFDFPKITFSEKVELYESFKIDPSISQYNLYYLGKYRKKLNLENRITIPALQPQPYFINDKYVYIDKIKDPYEKYGYIDNDEDPRDYQYARFLEITIDTSIKINHSNPVLVRNLHSETVQIGWDSRLPFIMEAKDIAGFWRPIQKYMSVMCGTGVYDVILPANEVAITLAPIYKGKFKTQLRLSYGNIKSNVFWGSIDYNQLKSLKEVN